MALVLGLIVILMGLGIAGTVIEMSKIGDIHNLDYERLKPVAKFYSIKQYEPVVIQRKKPWA